MKMNDNGTFTLDGKHHPLKTFLPEEIYLGKLCKVFWDARREKKMGISLKTDENKKNWREKKNYCRTLKTASTKADTELEEADDSNTVFSDHTFMVAADPNQVQSHSASATSSIP